MLQRSNRTTTPSTARRLAVAAGAALTLFATVGAPAQAVDVEAGKTTKNEYRDTTDCPCYIGDAYDGTYFKRDIDGLGAKMSIFKGSELVGKAEFHPYSEEFWIYDTKADGDALYYTLEENGRTHGPYRVASGDRVRMIDFNFPEGTDVTVKAWDALSGPGGKYPVHQIGAIGGTA